MRKSILLISGKMGSGKTTLGNAVAEDLSRIHKLYVNHLSFAAVIYEMHDAIRTVGDKYGIPRVEPKDGPLLQLLGTEWGRNMDEDIWVKSAKKKADTIFQSYDKQGEDTHVLIIISDARFTNEFDGFSDALRIRLECDRETRMKRCTQWRENETHPSEVGLDHYAACSLFDSYYDTKEKTVKEIVPLVSSKILRGGWIEKRKM